MKSLSVGDEAGDLAEPRRISARVKNRNPTVPCWLSLMSAALVTELAASEPPPLQSSIPPPPPIPLLLSLSVFLGPTLLHTHVFLSLPPPCSFSLPVSPTILSLSPSDLALHYLLLRRRLSVRHKLCCSSFQHSLLLYIVVTPFSPHVAQLN